MSAGVNHRVWFVEQPDPTVIPVEPALTEFPYTNSSLNVTREILESEKLGSQHRKCVRLGNKSVGGSNAFELTYGDFDVWLAAIFQATWATDTPILGTDQLKLGTALRKKYLFARNFPDMEGPDKWLYYMGMEANTLSLSIAPNSNVTGSIEFVGLDDGGDKHDAITGATFIPASDNCPFDSFNAEVVIDGVPTAEVTQLDMNITRNLTANYSIGKVGAHNIAVGKINGTGTITLWFENMELYKKFQNEEHITLAFTLTSPAGALSFSMGNVKLTGGQPDVSDDGDISIAMDIHLLYDSVAQAEVVAERTPI